MNAWSRRARLLFAFSEPKCRRSMAAACQIERKKTKKDAEKRVACCCRASCAWIRWQTRPWRHTFIYPPSSSRHSSFFFNLTYTVTKPAQFAFLFILLTPMMLYVLTGRIQVHSFYFYSGGVFLLRRLILGAKHSAQLNAGREVSP